MLTEHQGPCLWKDGPPTGNPSPGVEGGHPSLMKDDGWNKWRAAYRGTSDVLSPEGESSGPFDLWPEPCSCVCVHACILRVKPPSVLNSLILCFIYFWEEWWQKCDSAAQLVSCQRLSLNFEPSNFEPPNAANGQQIALSWPVATVFDPRNLEVERNICAKQDQSISFCMFYLHLWFKIYPTNTSFTSSACFLFFCFFVFFFFIIVSAADHPDTTLNQE